ncbi:ABC transporter substrate-binding protein [Emcibacter sp. SYSU 3D8]|uniref:ABC transporter substrate-binding protein n=1 Tax=Emcibacter sp. SYSU 3D8 TaxID=3133969 RepID=UPI0031FF1BBA
MTAPDRRTVLRGGMAAMAAAAIPGLAVAQPLAAAASEKLVLHLEWLPQAEFAGYLVARELGLFSKRGLDVTILPGGPDHPALAEVATGAAHIGIGPSSLLFVARAKSVPVKIIALPLQDSIFRFVLKARNRILSLRQLAGQPIGLRLGGDEAEFAAMAAKQGMTLADFKVVRQDQSLSGFLEDRYVLSQVTTINELILLRNEGYPESELQILSPAEYGVAMPSDCLFTTDTMLETRRDTLVRFIDGARDGWRTAFADKEAAVQLLVSRYPELDAGHQMDQLKAMEPLVSGPDGGVPFGRIDTVAMERMQQEMVTARLLPGVLFLNDVVDASLLRDLPEG